VTSTDRAERSEGPAVSPDDLLTVREAAAYARVGRPIIYAAIADQRLQHIRIGLKVIRIRRQWIDDFMDSQVVEPVSIDPPAAAVGSSRR
jgi:excisionase family DNA binding protein